MGILQSPPKQLSLPPSYSQSSFPIKLSSQYTHKTPKITNVLVILKAQKAIFFNKFFSSSTPVFTVLKSYIDICSLVFQEGESKGKPLTKEYYQLPLHNLHIDGNLRLRVEDKKFIFQEQGNKISYIKQQISQKQGGIVFEDVYYSESKQNTNKNTNIQKLVFQEDSLQTVKKNVSSLLRRNQPSQVRRFIHQSYKKLKKTESQFLIRSQVQVQRQIDREATQPSRVIGKLFQNQGINVSYEKKSSLLSHYSILAVLGQIEVGYCEANIKIDMERLNFKLSDVKDSQLKRLTIIQYIKEYSSRELKIEQESIYVLSINQTEVTIAYPHHSQSSMISNQKRIFDQLSFSEEDFDPRGHRNYMVENVTIEERGGYPYYKPIGWLRFGLNVTHYSLEDGNSEWIDKNNSNEWAVMYHGVKNPTKTITNGNSIAYSIAKFGFKIGHNHVHEKIPPFINKKMLTLLKNKGISIDDYLSEKIYTIKSVQNVQYEARSLDNSLGQGVYGSPLLNQVCVEHQYAGRFVMGNKQYVLAFQCKVRPESIYISSNEKRYWLIRNPADIRPYAILIAQRLNLNQPHIQKAKHKISRAYCQFCKSQNLF